MSHDRARALLERQLTEGPLPAAEDAELRAHLGACAPCRALYDRHVEVERTLEGRSTPRAQVERLLARGAPLARGAQVTAAPAVPSISARRARLQRALPALALAASVLLALALGLRGWSSSSGGGPRSVFTAEAPELQARGGGRPSGRTAWVDAFHRPRGQVEVVPLGASVRAGDALLFAYTRLAGDPTPYLAVAGRDAAKHVQWYFPAWRSASEDPVSVPTREGANVELHEALIVAAAPGTLELCALFTAAPLHVREVDRALEEEGRWPEAASRDCRTVEVLP